VSASDDAEWCSIYGYDIPPDHACSVAVCYNPYRDGQELKGTLDERIALAKSTVQEIRSW
jgi:hypothetical protein